MDGSVGFRVVIALLALASASAQAQVAPRFTDISPPGGAQRLVVHPLDGDHLMVVSSGTVKRSRDGGATWTATALPAMYAAERIFVHRGRPGVVYVQELATRTTHAFPFEVRRGGGRTFRSEDFGETWTQLTPGFRDDGDLVLSPFASDPLAPEHVFATGRTFFYCSIACGLAFGPWDASLRESHDGGLTWSEPLPGLPPSSLPGTQTSIDGPTPAAPHRLFFGIRDTGTFVSTDSGRSWSGFPTPPPGSSFHWIRQDPFRADVLYAFGEKVGGVQEHRRSDDGGATWRVMWGAFTSDPPSLAVDPVWKDRLWLYGVAGVLLSDDGGLTWTRLGLAAEPSSTYSTGLDPNTGVAALEPDPTDSSRVYAIRSARLYRGTVSARSRVAVEYQYGDRFWLTGEPAEATSQDYRGNEAVRTGQVFGLWSALDAPAGALPICRFQGDPARGQHSRFIALADHECDVVKGNPAFVLEGEGEYFAVPPAGDGSCAGGLLPVRRFNNLQASVNHRYVVASAVAEQMRAAGWYDEGVRFCARPLGSEE